MKHPGLSTRAYNRVFVVARTLADIKGSEQTMSDRVSEDIQHRSVDWKANSCPNNDLTNTSILKYYKPHQCGAMPIEEYLQPADKQS
jgi:magnesium chelatase subunit ChlI-like protein